MKVFIWPRCDHMTHNYHEEGGAIAVAESLERAKELLRKEGAATAIDTDQCRVYEIRDEGISEYAEVFPDAGCC